MAGARHDRRVLGLVLAGGLPALGVALLFIWHGDFSGVTRLTVTGFLIVAWIGFALGARTAVVRPLQTLANVLAALRQEDYSTDARGADREDPLGLVLAEANALRELLRERRLGALEATALLRTVMSEIEVAVFAFDETGVLRLINRAGESLLGTNSSRALGAGADELGLRFALEGEAPRTLEESFPGATGRWELRRGEFRQAGHVHTLVVLSDLSRVLREEERQAWQRLVRVLSHEINNSLAPISSIAETLTRLLARDEPAMHAVDLREGLDVIGRRADSLRRFMTAYARLAHLPPPRRATVELRSLVERIARLEDRRIVRMSGGPDVTVDVDRDQLEQALINLVRNAVDAVEESGRPGGEVDVSWRAANGDVEILITDEGPGIGDTANLFVPFFTTKPGGSGIGLALSRQIAEAHGGTLVLENRSQGRGCVARLALPA